MNATRKERDIAAEDAFYAGFEAMRSDDFGAYVAPEQVALYKEDCSKCGGRGYIGAYSHREAGRCYQCDGKGFMMFKQPKEVREKRRTQAAASKANRQQRAFEAFEAEHPEIAAWWTGSNFPFAVSLRDACLKYGSLTEGQDGNGGQLAAAYKCARKFNAMKAEREAANAARTASAPVVDISGLERSFQTAQNNGLKRIKLRLLGKGLPLLFFPANEHAKPENQGAIYVKDDRDGSYIGKIKDGRFMRSRDCSDELFEAVIDACKAPEEAAVAYGMMFGSCSCCGKTLTNALSIKLGIGPICRGKFFG